MENVVIEKLNTVVSDNSLEVVRTIISNDKLVKGSIFGTLNKTPIGYEPLDIDMRGEYVNKYLALTKIQGYVNPDLSNLGTVVIENIPNGLVVNFYKQNTNEDATPVGWSNSGTTIYNTTISRKNITILFKMADGSDIPSDINLSNMIIRVTGCPELGAYKVYKG